MKPTTAIIGLEKEIIRIDLQGVSSFQSINLIQDEKKLGIDIEIIKQIQKIKPKIQLFYEDRTEIKASRVSVGVSRNSKGDRPGFMVSNDLEKKAAAGNRSLQQRTSAS